MPVVDPNGLIVVTGITGYVASHVGLAALQTGLRVRGTVRSMERAQALKAAYSKEGVDVSDAKLEFVIVDDLLDQSQFEKAFKDAEGVAHVALPGWSEKQVDEAIACNMAVLRAAAKEPTMKRVVLTSSSAAVISVPTFKDQTLTDEDWNDAAIQRYESATEEYKKDPYYPRVRYGAAKTLSEKAAWKFIEDEKPKFDIVAILPNCNFGPLLHGEPRSTAAWVKRLMENDGEITTTLPSQWYIDVRDDGRLHVLGLTSESLGGKRIWAAAGPFGWNTMLGILRKNFPHKELPPNVEGEQGSDNPQKVDNSVATKALGGWISLEKSIVDAAKAYGF